MPQKNNSKPKKELKNKGISTQASTPDDPVTLSELLDRENITVESIDESELLENISDKRFTEEPTPVRARKPVVASFITTWLIYLFVFQMGAITLAHIVLVIASFNIPNTLELASGILLDGVQTILPYTTTLLGVVIGYYFREVVNDEKHNLQK